MNNYDFLKQLNDEILADIERGILEPPMWKISGPALEFDTAEPVKETVSVTVNPRNRKLMLD